MRMLALLLLAACSPRAEGLGGSAPLPVPVPMRAGGTLSDEAADGGSAALPPATATNPAPSVPDAALPADSDVSPDAVSVDWPPPSRDAAPTDLPRPVDGRPAVDVRPPVAATRFAGTLSRSNTAKFGGSPYCFYFVTMLELSSTITFDSTGGVSGAQVTNTMDETVDSCPHAPVGRRPYAFSLLGSTIKGNAVTIHYRGAAANSPTASLTFFGTRSATAVTGTFTWQRTDQGTSNLAWTVTGAVTHTGLP